MSLRIVKYNDIRKTKKFQVPTNNIFELKQNN